MAAYMMSRTPVSALSTSRPRRGALGVKAMAASDAIRPSGGAAGRMTVFANPQDTYIAVDPSSSRPGGRAGDRGATASGDELVIHTPVSPSSDRPGGRASRAVLESGGSGPGTPRSNGGNGGDGGHNGVPEIVAWGFLYAILAAVAYAGQMVTSGQAVAATSAAAAPAVRSCCSGKVAAAAPAATAGPAAKPSGKSK